MLKLSKQADYATVLLSCLAERRSALLNVGELADATGVSSPMVSKTLKLLTRGGLVEYVRGAAGGYRLCRQPDRISVAEIVRAVEGPIALTECSGNDNACSLTGHCRVQHHWQIINATIIDSLSQLSLADLLQPATTLRRHTSKELTSHVL